MSDHTSDSGFDGDPEGKEGEESPIKILLGEIPAPRVPATPPISSPSMEMVPVPEAIPDEPEPPQRPSRLEPIRNLVGLGVFNPFKAFEFRVDWDRFRKAQIFLFLMSLVIPFLMLLVFGALMGVVNLTGTSLNSATSPNSTYELMLYPLAFVFAKGYWLAYLALPLAVFILGWTWALITSWSLTRDTDPKQVDFKKALSILAMLGAMMAPFTMFPFLRLVALAWILWFTVRRMEDSFAFSFWTLVGRGGITFVFVTFTYGYFERKVESFFPASTELQSNITGFIQHGKKLDWPSFRIQMVPRPIDDLCRDLGSLDSDIRDQAAQKALSILKGNRETPEARFRLAQRMVEFGQTDAKIFLARYYANGQGTVANPDLAGKWYRSYLTDNPKDLNVGLETARHLIKNQKALEGKRKLVEIAKDQIINLGKITDFIQKEGLGKSDSNLNYKLQNLYKPDKENFNSYNYNNYNSYGYNNYNYRDYRSSYHVPTPQEILITSLPSDLEDKSYWFYRAMAAEYGGATVAGEDVYGEPVTELTGESLKQRIGAGDRVALEIAGDRSMQAGDIAKAREYWLIAAKALNNDNRRTNQPFYMKIAESYDPELTKKDANPREAIRYYLATVLISNTQGRSNAPGIGALRRLVQVPDLDSQAFIDLCLKYDVAEGWVQMGARYQSGDTPGVAKNPAKAKEYFLKAQELGYQGPEFFRQLAILDPANAEKWIAQSKAK